jgi:hypothetical protein
MKWDYVSGYVEMVAKPILEIGDVSRMGSSPITPITFKNRDFNFK